MRKIRYILSVLYPFRLHRKLKTLTKVYTAKVATVKLQNIGEVVIDSQTQLLNLKYVCSHMYSLADQRLLQSLMI